MRLGYIHTCGRLPDRALDMKLPSQSSDFKPPSLATSVARAALLSDSPASKLSLDINTAPAEFFPQFSRNLLSALLALHTSEIHRMARPHPSLLLTTS